MVTSAFVTYRLVVTWLPTCLRLTNMFNGCFSCEMLQVSERCFVCSSNVHSNFSCTFYMPITHNQLFNESLFRFDFKTEAAFVRVLHTIMNSSADYVAVCMYFCKLKRLSVKFDLGSTCILNVDHITSTFFLFSLDKSQVVNIFKPIHINVYVPHICQQMIH